MIKASIACDEAGGIAKNGKLPWPKNAKDMRRFQKLTTNTTVVMGRKTWEAVDMPSPLPYRKNVVVTRDKNYQAEGATVINGDLKNNLTKLVQSSTVFVIGGAQLLSDVLDEIQILHLTRISGVYECDTFVSFDKINEKFKLIECIDVDEMIKFETYFARRLYDL